MLLCWVHIYLQLLCLLLSLFCVIQVLVPWPFFSISILMIIWLGVMLCLMFSAVVGHISSVSLLFVTPVVLGPH